MTVLVDYGAGNLQSVANALRHLGVAFEITDRPETVARAGRVILPGVGAAASCMRALAERGLEDVLRAYRRPLLGICLGMQVLTESSSEGSVGQACLGLLPGRAARFDGGVRIPQMGWNTVVVLRDDPLFHGIPSGAYFYFAHSYRVHTEPDCVVAETEYGGRYPSVIRRGPVWGVQFHPEKSGGLGLRLLRNFVERC